jgi:cytochrome c
MAKIAQQARTGAMPTVQYLALHWNARLSASDIQTLAKLTEGAGQNEPGSAGNGDPESGKNLFQKRCTGCHALNADREGPRLAGVFGRKAGSVPGFAYSSGLKKLSLTWTDENLEKWLSDPDVMVPDNNMSFRVPKADERRDLIAFLRQ